MIEVSCLNIFKKETENRDGMEGVWMKILKSEKNLHVTRDLSEISLPQIRVTNYIHVNGMKKYIVVRHLCVQ